ncbi:MAG: hypothetical protein IT178_00765 [Acidobacteria bacterium]|nr:hypothetical protein [Acidobacteriota bacterium]
MIKIDINTAIATRALAGEVLTEAELLEADSADVLSLGMLADDVRRARVGEGVTYRRVLDLDAPGLSEGQRDAALASADALALTILPETLEELIERVRTARALSTRPLIGFGLDDLLARDYDSLPAVLGALKAAGLDAIASVPVDTVSVDDAGLVVASGLGVDAITVRQAVESGRTEIVRHLRTFAAAVPARAVAPLSIEQSVTTPTTGYSDVRLVGLARLALPSVRVIQVSWQQYGPKLAQVALTFGANHLDRVSPIDDPALGTRRTSIEDVRRNIQAAGLTPVDPAESR